ncbi:MAG TPA: hypothetical protein VGV86_11340 [Acidimicrobiales bacterium]|nr:hypothetical protein [Acidimicrobiales bacterium]
MTRRLKVAEGTQVTVDGKTYAAGETLDLEPHDATSCWPVAPPSRPGQGAGHQEGVAGQVPERL